MPFRQPPTLPEVRRVVYGPFPVQWGQFTVVVVLAACSALAGAWGMHTEKLTCTRAPHRAPTCVVEKDGPLSPAARRTLGKRDLARLRLVKASDARYPEFETDFSIVDDRGAAIFTIRFDRRSQAEELREQLSLFSSTDDPPPFSFETRPSWPGIILLLLSALILLAITPQFLRGGGRWEVVLDPALDTLRVVRSVFGVRRETLDLRLGDVRDVLLETGYVDAPRSEGLPPQQGGRLVLVKTDGSRHPLSDRMLPGLELHRRALVALRAALGLPGP